MGRTDCRTPSPADGGLICRNVTIAGRRTSVRLEPEMWLWLGEVSRELGLSVHGFCTVLDAGRKPRTSLTAAIRVEIARHFRDRAPRPERREAPQVPLAASSGRTRQPALAGGT